MHHRDARCAQAQFAGQGADAPRGAGRIGGAEVADDAHAVLQAQAQHRAQQVVEQRLVAALGVAAACQLGQRQGALGQRLENQHRRAAAGDQRIHHRQRRIGAVTGEAGRAADAQGRVRVHLCPFEGLRLQVWRRL